MFYWLYTYTHNTGMLIGFLVVFHEARQTQLYVYYLYYLHYNSIS